MIYIFDKDTFEIKSKCAELPGQSFDHLGSFNSSYCKAPELTGATHIIDSVPIIREKPIVPPTVMEIIKNLTKVIQDRLDNTAKSHNYDGILSLCSYATSLDLVFKAEAQAGIEWRDACWRKAYQVMGEVKAGTRAVPTKEELIAEMPVMIWPTILV